MNTFLAAVLLQVLLLQICVQLNLIHGRHHSRVLKQNLKVVDIEIRNTNCLYLTSRQEFLKILPCIHEIMIVKIASSV